MARPFLLPLPDEQARQVAHAARTIEAERPAASNREFLKSFIPAVEVATGQVFGPKVYQKLLKQFTPTRAPSSTTVQDEIRNYRRRQAYDHQALAEPREAGLEPAKPRRRPESEDISSLRDSTLAAAAELAKLQALEVDELRERANRMEARAIAADRARQEAVLEANAARAERAGLEQSLASLQQLVVHLTETIRVTQERAAADNRANLQRVDEVRGETREAEARVRALQSSLTERDKIILNANATIDAQRQQISQLRQQLQAPR